MGSPHIETLKPYKAKLLPARSVATRIYICSRSIMSIKMHRPITVRRVYSEKTHSPTAVTYAASGGTRGGVMTGTCVYHGVFFFSSRRRHTRFDCDWSSDVCSSD